MEGKKENLLLIPGAIVVAGAIIAGAIIYSNFSSTPRVQDSTSPTVENISEIPGDLADDDPFLGNPNASVILVEFADYQCPFCKIFHEGAEKEIINQYVKTGKAKLVYRDFPLSFVHPVAEKSAQAANCANEQGKFWEYHSLLYKNQGELSLSNLKFWAGRMGLDQNRFNSCLDSDKYAKEVAKDLAEGGKAGIEGTPSTFVNGRLIKGAVSFSEIQKVIEEELDKSSAPRI